MSLRGEKAQAQTSNLMLNVHMHNCKLHPLALPENTHTRTFEEGLSTI